jgi:glycosyltransferase involved in cell wall biosynthesis
MKLFLLPAVFRLRRFVQQQKITHLIDADVILSVVSVPALRGLPCRLISWEHFHFCENLGCRMRDFGRWLAKRFADAIVVLTEDDRKQYLTTPAKADIVCIPHVIPEKNDSPSACPVPDGCFILSVGRLDFQKGFERIPELAGPLFEKHPDLKWVLVGDGAFRSRIEADIRSRGLTGKILLAGWQNPYPFYEKAEFLVMTSRYEGFGLVLLESLSQSCPVIAFDCKCGPSDIVRDGENGFLVPAEDFAGLKEKITLLMDSPDLRKKLSDNAKASIRKFSADSFADRWNKLLLLEPEGVK